MLFFSLKKINQHAVITEKMSMCYSCHELDDWRNTMNNISLINKLFDYKLISVDVLELPNYLPEGNGNVIVDKYAKKIINQLVL